MSNKEGVSSCAMGEISPRDNQQTSRRPVNHLCPTSMTFMFMPMKPQLTLNQDELMMTYLFRTTLILILYILLASRADIREARGILGTTITKTVTVNTEVLCYETFAVISACDRIRPTATVASSRSSSMEEEMLSSSKENLSNPSLKIRPSSPDVHSHLESSQSSMREKKQLMMFYLYTSTTTTTTTMTTATIRLTLMECTPSPSPPHLTPCASSIQPSATIK